MNRERREYLENIVKFLEQEVAKQETRRDAVLEWRSAELIDSDTFQNLEEHVLSEFKRVDSMRYACEKCIKSLVKLPEIPMLPSPNITLTDDEKNLVIAAEKWYFDAMPD